VAVVAEARGWVVVGVERHRRAGVGRGKICVP